MEEPASSSAPVQLVPPTSGTAGISTEGRDARTAAEVAWNPLQGYSLGEGSQPLPPQELGPGPHGGLEQEIWSNASTPQRPTRGAETPVGGKQPSPLRAVAGKAQTVGVAPPSQWSLMPSFPYTMGGPPPSAPPAGYPLVRTDGGAAEALGPSPMEISVPEPPPVSYTGYALQPPFPAPMTQPSGYREESFPMDWYQGPGGQRNAMSAAIAQSSHDLRQSWAMPFDGPAVEVNGDGLNPYIREKLGIEPDADKIWVPQEGGDPTRGSIFGPPLSEIFGQQNVAPAPFAGATSPFSSSPVPVPVGPGTA